MFRPNFYIPTDTMEAPKPRDNRNYYIPDSHREKLLEEEKRKLSEEKEALAKVKRVFESQQKESEKKEVKAKKRGRKKKVLIEIEKVIKKED